MDAHMSLQMSNNSLDTCVGRTEISFYCCLFNTRVSCMLKLDLDVLHKDHLTPKCLVWWYLHLLSLTLVLKLINAVSLPQFDTESS